MEASPADAFAQVVRNRAGDAARTVLLADDDDDFRLALTETLVAEGHEVIAVASGEAALAVLDGATKGGSQSPDLLVLDLLMPRMSGIEVLQRLRKSARWRHLPVLVVTGINDPMLRVRLDLSIAFKPDIDAVLEAVRGHLSPRRPPLAPAAS